MRILFYNPVSQPLRFVPLEAIKGNVFFRWPNYDAMRLSYLSKRYSFYYYDEQIEEKPNFNPDIMVINIPLNLARYVENTIKEQWENKIITIGFGIYPTLYPEQAKKLCKVVVTGDIGMVWEKILADFEAGNLTKVYKAVEPGPFNVDRGLETKYGFTPAISQLRTSFGCQCQPAQKDYCYEKVLYKTDKKWEIAKIVKEVSRIQRKIIFVPDDDFLHNIDYAMRILEGCWQYKKMWVFQTTSAVFGHPGIFPILREDGVRILYLKEDWLGKELVKKIADKSFAKEKEHETNLIHNHHIAVGCKIRLGFEEEDFNFYQLLSKFLMNIKVDLIELAVQTPMPGTKTYKEYKKEGRIARDLSLYDQWMPVIQLKDVKPQELYSWMEWLRDRFYSWDSIIRRNVLVSQKLGFYNSVFFYLIPNLSYRGNFLEKVGYPP